MFLTRDTLFVWIEFLDVILISWPDEVLLSSLAQVNVGVLLLLVVLFLISGDDLTWALIPLWVLPVLVELSDHTLQESHGLSVELTFLLLKTLRQIVEVFLGAGVFISTVPQLLAALFVQDFALHWCNQQTSSHLLLNQSSLVKSCQSLNIGLILSLVQ